MTAPMSWGGRLASGSAMTAMGVVGCGADRTRGPAAVLVPGGAGTAGDAGAPRLRTRLTSRVLDLTVPPG